MRICLSKSRGAAAQTFKVHLTSRLPVQVTAACDLTGQYKVEAAGEYDHLTLNTTGTLQLLCQCCLEPFMYTYGHITELAVCANEEIASRLMAQFDCVVSEQGEINLDELITDDLHFFLPEKHPEGCRHDALY